MEDNSFTNYIMYEVKNNDAMLGGVYRKNYALKCKNSFLAVIIMTVNILKTIIKSTTPTSIIE